MGTSNQAVEPVVAASGTAPAKNLLVGCVTSTPVVGDVYKYVLVHVTDHSEFQKLYDGENGINVTIPAGRAYLDLSGQAEQAPNRLRIVFEEENATNIENLDASETAVKFFEDGQIFIKKNGIVYDALGRVIR